MKIDMEDIECFLMVAEQKSFTKAADLLFQTQPTISRKIFRLEEELGARLFDRTGKVLCLTEEGEIAFSKLGKIRDDLYQLRSDVCGRGNIHGKLRIAYYGVYDLQLIADITSAVNEKYPALELNYYVAEPGQAADDLQNGAADIVFAVRCELERLPGIQIEPLMRQRMVAGVPPKHRLAKCASIGIKDLQGECLTLWERENAPVFYDTILRECRKRGFVPNVRQNPRSFSEIGLSIMIEGNICILPEGCFWAGKNMGVIVPISDFLAESDYCMACRADRISAELKCFWKEALLQRDIHRWTASERTNPM